MVLLDEASAHKALAAKHQATAAQTACRTEKQSMPPSTFTFKAVPTSPKTTTCPSLSKPKPKSTVELFSQASRARAVALGQHCSRDVKRDSEPLSHTEVEKGCSYEDADSPPRKKSRSNLAMPPPTPRGRRRRKTKARVDGLHHIKTEEAEADSEPLKVVGAKAESPPQAPTLPGTKHDQDLEDDDNDLDSTTTPDYDYWQEPTPRWDLVPPRPVHICSETLCGPESKYCEHSPSLGPGPFSDKESALLDAERNAKSLQAESAKGNAKRISQAYSDASCYVMMLRCSWKREEETGVEKIEVLGDDDEIRLWIVESVECARPST